MPQDEKQTVVMIRDGITVTVPEDYDDIGDIMQELKVARRIRNAESIDLTHPDVIRLADAHGIKIKRNMSSQDMETLSDIIATVKDHQITMMSNVRDDALVIHRLRDIFDTRHETKIRLRSDLIPLAGQSDQMKVWESYFAPVITKRFMPSTPEKNQIYPVEQKGAIAAVFIEVICPEFFSLYREALNADEQMILDSGEDGPTDDSGFQPESVD